MTGNIILSGDVKTDLSGDLQEFIDSLNSACDRLSIEEILEGSVILSLQISISEGAKIEELALSNINITGMYSAVKKSNKK